jgi:adenosylcobinamide-GDP ribazoletransferase
MATKIRLDAPPKKTIKSKENRGIGFLGLISFSTILPLNIHSNIPDMARYTWMWPFIGVLIGIMVGGFAFLVANLLQLPSILSATLIYSFAILLTGLHHIDGLIDFGDGLMAHGDSKRRIEIMRDQRIGTGGLASFIIVAFITVASISTLPVTLIPVTILVSEVAAKIGLITCCTFSSPSGDGTGTFFIENMSPSLLALSLGISIVIGFLAVDYVGIMGIMGGFITGIVMAIVARAKFNWTTGDVLGASNEISRMISILLMVSILIVVV